MGRILFFLLLVVLIVFWFKGRKARAQAEFDARVAKEKQSHSVNMVCCPICGVHFAQGDGVKKNGRMYYSKSCADQVIE